MSLIAQIFPAVIIIVNHIAMSKRKQDFPAQHTVLVISLLNKVLYQDYKQLVNRRHSVVDCPNVNPELQCCELHSLVLTASVFSSTKLLTRVIL